MMLWLLSGVAFPSSSATEVVLILDSSLSPKMGWILAKRFHPQTSTNSTKNQFTHTIHGPRYRFSIYIATNSPPEC